MHLDEIINTGIKKTAELIQEWNQKWQEARVPPEQEEAAKHLADLTKIMDHFTKALKYI